MAAVLPLGVNYSWNNLTLVYQNAIFIGITKISFTEKQDKQNNYGQGGYPTSRGYGRITYDNGSLELYTDELKRLIAAAPNRRLLDIDPTDMYLLYGGTKVQPDNDTILAFEFLENPIVANEGDTKLLVTVPAIFAGLKR